MNQSEIVLYTTPDGTVKIDTIFQDETIWLTQKKMAELFDVKSLAITKHLKNIFVEDELDEKLVGSVLEHTTLSMEQLREKRKPDRLNTMVIRQNPIWG